MAESQEKRWAAFDATALAPGQVEELRRVVIDTEQPARLRFDALRMLARQAKPTEHEVLPTTVNCLFDEVPQIQQLAEAALLGWSNRAVPRILQAIRELPPEESAQRGRLIRFLGEFGPAAAVARPYLQSLEQDPLLGADVRATLPRLQEGMEQFAPWLGLVAQEWLIVVVIVFSALWLILEFAEPINLANWLPGKKGAQAAELALSRKLVFGLGLAAVLALQAARWLFRYSVPNAPLRAERIFRPALLLMVALLTLVVLTVVFIRLESLASR